MRSSACNEFSIIFAVSAHLRSMAGKFQSRVRRGEEGDNIRLIAAIAIQDAGFNVLEPPDGAQALGLLKHPDPVDVLFIDVSTPGSFAGVGPIDHVRTCHPWISTPVASGFAVNLSQRLATRSPPTFRVGKLYCPTKNVGTAEIIAFSYSQTSR